MPHVVKFSGGRSSAMLLFSLLENDLLDRGRGDVIVFNNTSAEHPATYRFVRDCMAAAQPYGVPFYHIEFQTYEDARRGEWTRLPTYRLVNAMPTGHGTAVIIPAFNNFLEDQSLWSMVAHAASANFFVAIEEHKLEVTVIDHRPNADAAAHALNRTTLSEVLEEHSDKRRAAAFLNG